MSDRKRITQLIQNYLDQIATESELAELQRLIVESPKAAADFANAVRLDASLANHFGEKRRMIDLSAVLDSETEAGISAVSKVRPRVASVPARKWFAAAAAVLLVASVAIVFWLSGRGDRPPVSTSPDYSVVSGSILVDGVASDVIRPGARLSVTGPVAAVIRLPDASQTQLEPDSELVVHGPVGDARQTVELLRGEGRFSIPEGRGRFCVDTPVGLITVLGTEFTVDLRSKERSSTGASDMKLRLAQILTVAVVFGTVEVDVGGKKYVLLGGESRVFAADKAREGEKNPTKRRGRPHFYAKFKAYDTSQKTLFAKYNREGEGRLQVTWDIDKDAEIIVDGKPGKISGLAEGCTLKVWFSDKTKKRVGALEAEGPSMGGRWGRSVSSVDAAKSTVTLRAGERPDNVKIYPVAKDATIIIDGKPGKLSDFSTAEKAWLRISADMKTIAYIRQGRSRGEEGEGNRKRPAPKKRTGKGDGEGEGNSKRGGKPQFYAKFKAYDTSQKTLFAKYNREGEGRLQVTWDIDKDAEIIVDGKPGKLSDLAEGCSLKVWFSDKAKKRVRALEAEGPTVGHRGGQLLSNVDAAKNTIILQSGEGAVEGYSVAKDATIIINGKPGKLSDLSTAEKTWLRMSADMQTIAYIRQGRSRGEGGEGKAPRPVRKPERKEGQRKEGRRKEGENKSERE